MKIRTSRPASVVVSLLVLALSSGCQGRAEPSSESGVEGPDESPLPGVRDEYGSVCKGTSDPGRATLHRLNRVEYDNTVRDLLGDTTRPSREFPSDDHGFGFDNNADVLSLSPLLGEKYSAAAEGLVERAWERESHPQGALAPLVRVCDPDVEGAPCVERILRTFATRAWRRPVTPAELSRLLRFVDLAAAQEDVPSAGVKLALQAVLVSPHFLYRPEPGGGGAPGTVQPVGDHALASRLSYFLWSSMPDEALLAAAESGGLRTPEGIEQQVRRMLGDPRARALVQNFAGQWLYTRALDPAQGGEGRFPGLDDVVRASMKEETERFFEAFLHEDRPLDGMLDADFTFLNDALATHYGLPLPGSTALNPVKLPPGAGRGGLLTQGAFLVATSHSDRTSPVLRGKWVLGQLLCRSPPPPPADVGTLPEEPAPGTSVREQLEQHRANPSCASCHKVMDPIGFGLETFDRVGRLRTMEEGGAQIDATGELPGGQRFEGALELSAILKQAPALTSCVARQLMVYGLGRGSTPDDDCILNELAEAAKARGNRLSDLIVLIARSPQFTMRRGAEVSR